MSSSVNIPTQPTQTDSELLRTYVEDGSQEAFAQLVQRYTSFVYSAARRQAPQQAEDVMQAVFILLAQKARALLGHKQLSGWLFQTVRNVARNAQRADKRRQSHERAAAEQTEQVTEAQVNEMEHSLDDVLATLRRQEREVLLLRFFRQMKFAEIATTLGTTEDAARVRVTRAIKSMRAKFVEHKVVAEFTAIEAMLLAHGQCAAPASAFVAAAKVAAAVKGGTAATIPAAGLLKGAVVMASVKTKVAIAAVAVLALAGTSAVVVNVVQRSATPQAAKIETLAPKLITKTYIARVGGAASWDPAPMSDDLKANLTKEQFEIFATPAGEAPTFSGRVEGLTNAVGAEIGVVDMRGVQWTSSSNYQYEKINDDGAFAISAKAHPDVPHFLFVRAKDQAITFLRAEFKPTESARNIVINMRPGKQIVLNATDSAGQPISWFQVEVFDGIIHVDNDGKPVEMQRLGNLKGAGGELNMSLPLEPVSLLVSGTNIAPFYQRIDAREADVFELRCMRSAQIYGKVTEDGKPVVGIPVLLVNDAAPLSATYRKTDKDGNYTLPNGVPGTYQVSVKKKRVKVDVAEGGKVEVNLELADSKRAGL